MGPALAGGRVPLPWPPLRTASAMPGLTAEQYSCNPRARC